MSKHDKIDGFSVPNDYFNQLSDRINSNIFITNLDTKIINSGFNTPNLYFENLIAKLLQTHLFDSMENKITKVIPFNIYKYAAAACILLFIALGIYFNSSYQTKVQYRLSSIPNEDIELYLQNETNTADMPVIIENVENPFLHVNQTISNQDLNEYLKESI